jgi:hypothetical protein
MYEENDEEMLIKMDVGDAPLDTIDLHNLVFTFSKKKDQRVEIKKLISLRSIIYNVGPPNIFKLALLIKQHTKIIVLVSLAQLARIMHKICKIRGPNPGHRKNNNNNNIFVLRSYSSFVLIPIRTCSTL